MDWHDILNVSNREVAAWKVSLDSGSHFRVIIFKATEEYGYWCVNSIITFKRNKQLSPCVVYHVRTISDVSKSVAYEASCLRTQEKLCAIMSEPDRPLTILSYYESPTTGESPQNPQ